MERCSKYQPKHHPNNHTNHQDPALTSALLDKIATSVECVICSEIMHAPFITECGHSFCYECLFAWFENKMNCPTCRHELEHLPVLNLKLKEVSKSLFDMMIDIAPTEDKDSMISQRQTAIKGYEHDREAKRLFGDLFKSVVTLLDTSDGVPRCGNCHWEANGSECLHCGARFRNPLQDSDDEVFYNTQGGVHDDDDDMNSQGEDRYDSDDSFVDSRPAEDIERDRDDSDSDILSDGSDWHGFEDRRESPIVISGDEDDLCDDDLISALEEFHDDHLNEVNRRHPQRRVIVISDDEE